MNAWTRSWIEREIVIFLNERHIQTVPEYELSATDVKLTVKTVNLDAIEQKAARSSVFYGTYMREQPIIRYSARLTGSGMTRFDYKDDRSNESLDKLTKIIAARIGERVFRFYR